MAFTSQTILVKRIILLLMQKSLRQSLKDQGKICVEIYLDTNVLSKGI